MRRPLILGIALAALVALGARYAVQPQPPPGSCHARGHGLFTLPDRHCTPGHADPRVTQATIATTICRSGYTRPCARRSR